MGSRRVEREPQKEGNCRRRMGCLWGKSYYAMMHEMDGIPRAPICDGTGPFACRGLYIGCPFVG